MSSESCPKCSCSPCVPWCATQLHRNDPHPPHIQAMIEDARKRAHTLIDYERRTGGD